MLRLFTLGLVFLFGASSIVAQTITAVSPNGTFCRSGSSSLSYALTGSFNAGNQFTAQLSDSSGSFSGIPAVLGTIASTSSGTINIVIPASLSYSTLYKIRLVSTNPVLTSNIININLENTASGTWVSKTALDTTGREYGVAFNIGRFGYFGMGQQPNTGSVRFRDMWQYNPETDVWTQMANYPVSGALNPIGFSIGSKGYVGVASGNNNFYEFDPSINAWRIRASFTGETRSNPVAFSIGGKGYVGTGRSTSTSSYLNDFFEFNPVTNSWQAIASFPGTARNFATAFTINNLGYVGLGFSGTTRERNFFVYNPSTNAWAGIAIFPGTGRQQSTAFSIGSRAYVGLGLAASFLSDMYEYNPTSNTWSAAIGSFTNASRRNAASFSIGSKGYLMAGTFGSTSPSQKRVDLWEYSSGNQKINISTLPSSTCAGVSFEIPFQVGCNPFNSGNVFTAELSDSLGSFASPIAIGSFSGTSNGSISANIPLATAPALRYQIRIRSSNPEVISSGTLVTINQPFLISLTSASGTNTQTVCINTAISNITYSVNGTASLSSTGLPIGVNANLIGGTLTVSGTPTQSGNFNFTLRLTSPCKTDSVSGTIVVRPTSTINTQPLSTPRQFCLGTSATPLFISASGVGLTYQWYSSLTSSNASGTVISGATDSFFTPPTNVVGQRYYYCQISSSCGSPLKTNVSGLQTIRSNGSWIGSASSDWSNSANWCGGLPTASNDAVIPIGTANSPSIISAPATCNNLIIQAGATLTLAPDQQLSVAGSIANSGTLQATEGIIEFIGSSEQTISGSLFANKTLGGLKISNSNGLILDGTNDTLKIKRVLSFGESNCVLSTNGNLTLLSDSLETASIADMTSDGITSGVLSGNRIVGNVVVERFIPKHNKAWQLLSVPAIGKTIRQNWQENASPGANPRPGFGTLIHSNLTGATLGFDGVTRTPSCLTYRSSNNTWVGVPSTNNVMNNPRGYYILIRGDRSVTEVDQPATATKLRITGQVYQPEDNPPPIISVSNGKLETVGNPYASALDMTKFQRVRVQDVYYIFDPNLTSGPGSSALGGYRTLTRVGSGYIATPAETSGSSYYRNTNTNVQIQSGQAFFILSDNTGAGSLTIDESCKASGSALVTKNSVLAPRISINLYTKENNLIDGVLLRLDGLRKSNSTSMRAPKFTLGMQEYISIFDGKQELSVLQRTAPVGGETVELKLHALTDGVHTLEIHLSDYTNEKVQIFLEDRLTKSLKLIDQHVEFNYPFVVDSKNASTTENRFVIRFNKYKERRSLKDFVGSINQDSIVSPNWKLINNPILGNQWNYTWYTMSSGTYRLEIFTSSGQSVHRQFIELPTGSGTGQFHLKRPLVSGLYRVVLSNRQGKRFLQTVSVQ